MSWNELESPMMTQYSRYYEQKSGGQLRNVYCLVYCLVATATKAIHCIQSPYLPTISLNLALLTSSTNYLSTNFIHLKNIKTKSHFKDIFT